jgi:hypothetical protein
MGVVRVSCRLLSSPFWPNRQVRKSYAPNIVQVTLRFYSFVKLFTSDECHDFDQ